MNTASEPKFPIGTKFLTAGKRKDLCTVVDILKTYNAANELVKVVYVASHEFLGRTVTDYDVPCSCVARGVWALEESNNSKAKKA